jgi:hypothetical protein
VPIRLCRRNFRAPPAAHPPIRTVVWIAMAIPVAQLIAALWADELERPAQLFYIASLAAPAVLLLTAYPPERGRGDRRTLLLLVAMGLVWAALRLAVSLGSPRTADTVDTLGQLAMLQQTENTGLNVLRSGALMGVPYLPFVVQGAGLFGSWGLRPSLRALQLLNVVWSIVTAVGVGWLAARIVAPAAALVAAAAFLFSPFMLLRPRWCRSRCSTARWSRRACSCWCWRSIRAARRRRWPRSACWPGSAAAIRRRFRSPR